MKRALCIALTALGVLVVGVPSGHAFQTLDSCDPYWHSSTLPLTYVVNENVPSSLSDVGQVRDVFQESFDVWSSPCCSYFTATDGGTTSATGDNYNDRYNTLGFALDSWPGHLGDSRYVLAVTVPVYGRAGRNEPCYIQNADILFNAVGSTYIDGQPSRFGESDLQSIATHEIGHFLGLDHTSVGSATMFASYDGGTGSRSLHQDDIDGVCFLYEQSCTCSSDADCAGRQECVGSSCEIPPCQSDSECSGGQVCQAGDCIAAPCSADSDCSSGFTCQAGACGPACRTCTECETNNECGGANGICIPEGVVGATSACTSICRSDDECDGDALCWTLETDQGLINLCFNANADTAGLCPEGYVCGGGDGGGTTGGGGGGGTCDVCDGCSSDGDCGAGGTCLAFVGGPTVCSTSCDDGSCPGNAGCFALEDEGGGVENWCLNDDAASAGICAGGWSCTDSSTGGGGSECNPACEAGQTCNPTTGQCEAGVGGTGGTDLDDVGGGTDGDVSSGETEPGRPPSSCAGCTTHAVPTGGLALVLGLLALVGLSGRRRRG